MESQKIYLHSDDQFILEYEAQQFQETCHCFIFLPLNYYDLIRYISCNCNGKKRSPKCKETYDKIIQVLTEQNDKIQKICNVQMHTLVLKLGIFFNTNVHIWKIKNKKGWILVWMQEHTTTQSIKLSAGVVGHFVGCLQYIRFLDSLRCPGCYHVWGNNKPARHQASQSVIKRHFSFKQQSTDFNNHFLCTRLMRYKGKTCLCPKEHEIHWRHQTPEKYSTDLQ